MSNFQLLTLVAACILGILIAEAGQRWLSRPRNGRRRQRPEHWLLVFLLLCAQSGCAVSARYYKPMVYPTSNVNMANLAADTETCRRFAQRATSEDPTVTEGVAIGTVSGALLGAIIGVVIGAAFNDPSLGVILGVAEGGMAGGIGGGGSNYIEREKRKKEAINLCLRARGYAVAQ